MSKKRNKTCGLFERILGPPEEHVTVTLASGDIRHWDIERSVTGGNGRKNTGDRRVVANVRAHKEKCRQTDTDFEFVIQGAPGRNPAITAHVHRESVGVLKLHHVDTFPVAAFVIAAFADT